MPRWYANSYSAEIEDLLLHVQGWQVNEVDGMKRLERAFRFKNFVKALDFTDKVGTAAEEENHPPRIITEWDRLPSNGRHIRLGIYIRTI